MKKQSKFKQFFCIHPCFEDEKHYGHYGGSYVYQCSICGAYVGHLAPIGRTFRISKECYQYFIERNKS